MTHLQKTSSTEATIALERPRSAIGELYHASTKRKVSLFSLLFLFLVILIVFAIAVGSFDISVRHIVEALLGMASGPTKIVVWNNRMPRITAAIVTGCGLGLSGVAVQSLLKNPLASPFTLGISKGPPSCGICHCLLGAGSEVQGSALRTSPPAVICLITCIR
jgi:iron complex transport system permease protein